MPQPSAREAREPLLAVGQVVGSHRVERLVGRGGLAEVYLVTERSFGVEQALKLLVDTDPDLAQRLFREGRAQYLVQHPNILRVFSSLTVMGRPALLMEYVDGPDLRRWLGRQRRAGHWPSRAVALSLFDQILDGMIAAHAAGLIHRDLKPGNILLDLGRDPIRPRITDFGLVKDVRRVQEEEREITSVGTMMGTRGYSAPEQLWGLPDIDARADVYSLGCLLYLLVCGRAPFEGEEELSVLRRMFNDQYTDPQDLVPDLPAEVAMAIRHCLVAERRDRLPSCQALRDVLDRGSGALLALGMAPRALPPPPRAVAEDDDTTQAGPLMGEPSAPSSPAASQPDQPPTPSLPPLSSLPSAPAAEPRSLPGLSSEPSAASASVPGGGFGSSPGFSPASAPGLPNVGSESSFHHRALPTPPPRPVGATARAVAEAEPSEGDARPVRWALIGAVALVALVLGLGLVAIPAGALWLRGRSAPAPELSVVPAPEPVAPAAPRPEPPVVEEAAPAAVASPAPAAVAPPAPAAVAPPAPQAPSARPVRAAPAAAPSAPPPASAAEPVEEPEEPEEPVDAGVPMVRFAVRGISQQVCLRGHSGEPPWCEGEAPPGSYDILLMDGGGGSFVAGQKAISGARAIITCDPVFQTCF